MAADVLKGVVATSLYILVPYYLHDETERTNFMVGLGLAAVTGHIFPIWAEFRGGKGVATLFGMIIAIQPLAAVCCVAVFLLVLYLTRFVSLSSILGQRGLAVADPLYLRRPRNPLPAVRHCRSPPGRPHPPKEYFPAFKGK